MASDSVDSDELVITAALVAIALSKGRNADELGIIGNFFATIGAAVLLTQAVVGRQESRQDDQKTEDKIKDLENQMKELKACCEKKT